MLFYVCFQDNENFQLSTPVPPNKRSNSRQTPAGVTTRPGETPFFPLSGKTNKLPGGKKDFSKSQVF